MRIFRYSLKLLDPLFYSREGLSGAITPRYIHATALNHAVAYSLGINPEMQPYIIGFRRNSEDVELSKNEPEYTNSIVTEGFYFTPARPISNIDYFPEIVKGELDGFLRKGYGNIKLPNGTTESRPETLKASQLYFISPETKFMGYILCNDEIEFPRIIRLGSFRGKALLRLEKEYMHYKSREEAFVDHPVDPLVSEVLRGIMINMFPYPIVENARCRNCVEIKEGIISKYIALAPPYFQLSNQKLVRTDSTIIV